MRTSMYNNEGFVGRESREGLIVTRVGRGSDIQRVLEVG